MNRGIIIIPTYNEAENILLLLQKIFSLPVLFDVLIVDDNSPDGTAELAMDYAMRSGYGTGGNNHMLVVDKRPAKLGLGTAYIHGFKRAMDLGYEYIFEMDADFSHNPSDLVSLYEACAVQGYDMAIGSRYITGVNVVNWPIGRVLLSYFASTYVNFITGMPIKDATAGFKCYHRKVLETINLDKISFIGYAFQIEMKFLAWKYGFRIQEVPIIFTERKRGESKMSASIIKEAVWGVISIKINSFFRKFHPVSQT